MLTEGKMSALRRQHRVRSAETISVLRVVAVEGALSRQVGDDVVREVVYYFAPDGELLARVDPCDRTPT